jgi:hypothetical protein
MKLEVTRDVIKRSLALYRRAGERRHPCVGRGVSCGDEAFTSTLRKAEALQPTSEYTALRMGCACWNRRDGPELWIIAGAISLGGLILLIALIGVILLTLLGR